MESACPTVAAADCLSALPAAVAVNSLFASPAACPPLQSENEALQKLLVQLAADREAAERKLAEVKQQYSAVPAEKEALAAELDAGSMPAALAEIAAATAPPPPETAKPPPPEAAKPRPGLLQQLAERAMAQGQRIFVVPEGGAPVGQTVVLYYERTRGPLPGNADIGLKVRPARGRTHGVGGVLRLLCVCVWVCLCVGACVRAHVLERA